MSEIHLLAQDLRREEIIIQVADVLEKLNLYCNKIFDKVDANVNKFRERLEEVDRRSNVVKAKISKLRESGSKATKVFSSYKYPQIERWSYEPISGSVTVQENEIQRTIIRASHAPYDDEVLKDKLRFFSVEKARKRDSFELNENYRNYPLGRVPWERINSVASLVVFNTSENPFVTRSRGSSLVDHRLKNRKHFQASEVDAEDASTPALSAPTENHTMKGLLRYNPELQAAPQIMDELPIALPYLPGIADDLNFDSLTDTEAVGPGSIMQLPDYRSPSRTNSSKLGQPAVTSSGTVVPSVPPPPPPPPPPMSPPPPPPPMPEIKTEVTVLPSTAAPPPPPPPPVMESARKETKLTSSASMPSISNDRANLLASIRSAAGKPLKTRTTIKDEKLERKKIKKEAVSGDLMADLKNSLISRRKGITGSQPSSKPNDASATSPTGAMANVSALIPPPMTKKDSEDENEDEDTTDVDDWD